MINYTVQDMKDALRIKLTNKELEEYNILAEERMRCVLLTAEVKYKVRKLMMIFFITTRT
jgi:hypothetical protein